MLIICMLHIYYTCYILPHSKLSLFCDISSSPTISPSWRKQRKCGLRRERRWKNQPRGHFCREALLHGLILCHRDSLCKSKPLVNKERAFFLEWFFCLNLYFPKVFSQEWGWGEEVAFRSFTSKTQFFSRVWEKWVPLGWLSSFCLSLLFIRVCDRVNLVPI